MLYFQSNRWFEPSKPLFLMLTKLLGPLKYGFLYKLGFYLKKGLFIFAEKSISTKAWFTHGHPIRMMYLVSFKYNVIEVENRFYYITILYRMHMYMY